MWEEVEGCEKKKLGGGVWGVGQASGYPALAVTPAIGALDKAPDP